MCSQIEFAHVLFILVGLCFMPYESHYISKCNLNSEPLLYMRYQHLGYLHNQILLVDMLMQSDDFLKNSSLIIFSFFVDHFGL
jgi:hypothetical protein